MDKFYRNSEWTYAPSPYVSENTFIDREPENAPLPTYEEARDVLPRPTWEGHDDAIACYNKAWELAFGNLRQPEPGSGFVSNFIDTAFNGCTFMWDSSFILMFGKYGSRVFNFQNTLNNFYSHQHKDGFISREIEEDDGSEKFTRFDPSATGPNVMPWCEWEYYLNIGDKKRIGEIFPVLLAYHRWLHDNHTWFDGTYWTSGLGCGMDNQPRMSPGYNVLFTHGHMVWTDTCFQMILSGHILIEMAKILGREEDAEFLVEEQKMLKSVVNDKLWDENTHYYYDMWRGGKLSGVKTIGAYWALLAGVVPKERADAFVAHLENPDEFNRHHRPPTLSADHPEYVATGGYWRGSIWAPTQRIWYSADLRNTATISCRMTSRARISRTSLAYSTKRAPLGRITRRRPPTRAHPQSLILWAGPDFSRSRSSLSSCSASRRTSASARSRGTSIVPSATVSNVTRSAWTACLT